VGTLRVVSVSLGSRRRDHTATVELLGRPVEIARRGVDGDVEAARRAIAELDGRVDAIGLGGVDVYLQVGDERYVLADGERLLRAAVRTPCVDGSGLKQTLEPRAVRWLAGHGPWPLAGRRVLLVSAFDRYGMACALEEIGCEVRYGDLMFHADVPYAIRSLAELERMARRLLREMVKLPIHMLYPTGTQQERPPEPRFLEHFAWAEVVAGDFHLIRRHLPGPEVLAGKAVLTQTTTAEDRAELAARGVRYLFTTTPLLAGRSFGTNALEAALVAVAGRGAPLAAGEYEEMLDAMRYRPEVIDLAAEGGDPGAGARGSA